MEDDLDASCCRVDALVASQLAFDHLDVCRKFGEVALVLLQVMLSSFWVATTKREAALVRSQGWSPWQGRGWTLAQRDRGPEAGVYCLERHYAIASTW
jgi:hypothetical protein